MYRVIRDIFPENGPTEPENDSLLERNYTVDGRERKRPGNSHQSRVFYISLDRGSASQTRPSPPFTNYSRAINITRNFTNKGRPDGRVIKLWFTMLEDPGSNSHTSSFSGGVRSGR